MKSMRNKKNDMPASIRQFDGGGVAVADRPEDNVRQLDAFAAALQHMSEEHEKGDIGVKMNPESFPGVFKSMAQSVNDMVAGHITVKKKAMACVNEFAKGN